MSRQLFQNQLTVIPHIFSNGTRKLRATSCNSMQCLAPSQCFPSPSFFLSFRDRLRLDDDILHFSSCGGSCKQCNTDVVVRKKTPVHVFPQRLHGVQRGVRLRQLLHQHSQLFLHMLGRTTCTIRLTQHYMEWCRYINQTIELATEPITRMPRLHWCMTKMVYIHATGVW